MVWLIAQQSVIDVWMNANNLHYHWQVTQCDNFLFLLKPDCYVFHSLTYESDLIADNKILILDLDSIFNSCYWLQIEIPLLKNLLDVDNYLFVL